MGLGFSIKGKVNGTTDSESILQIIADYTEAESKGIFATFLEIDLEEDTLYLSFHPCEEPVSLFFEEGILFCSAKTNSVGPGYHAYLIEFFEKAGKDLSIDWVWNETTDDESFGDETGYQENKDFPALQECMAEWLQMLSTIFLKDDQKGYLVSLPANTPRVAHKDFFVASSLGFWTRNWFEELQNKDLTELEKYGKQFFIWWDKEPDARFLVRTGVALLNADCGWHAPLDDDEMMLYEIIDKCFEEAKKLNPDVIVPEKDWEYIKAYLEGEEDVEIPESPLGFRKNAVTYDIAGDWKITVPGFFYSGLDEETEVFWFGDKTVRNTVYSFDSETTPEEMLASLLSEEDYPSAEKILYDDGKIKGHGYVYYYINAEEEAEYWLLQGVKVEEGSFIFTTICFASLDEKDWAVEVWNSITH
ncbi:hypothetical protein MYP_1535 [Sporocytophaga myxococcoides]|uniref:Uncharacterized protein n=1 Tax=Sporocytophaga myxococcoides TaxID=153721 RepID=A0A098LD29_9BACT|nr:hypothetical protein [Sporocytophaga myxococcoides]GAL84307.1 hypothetical protein MYP_1535 [Sporocytophaga myxococcoides]